jgi:tetratricopeptide (TPR) repeat protein
MDLAPGDRYGPPAMTHERAEDACLDADDVDAYLHARLPAAARGALERHVARCSACRELLSALAVQDGAAGADSIATTLPRLDADASLELTPGARVGRYVVRARLGAGGMGVVYAAHDPELDRAVALKLLRGDAGGEAARESLGARLRQEAQAMARLAHPNVVAVYDVGSFGAQIFVAMELIEGVTLGAWLAAAPRAWPEILAVFAQAGQGLCAAHAAGLTHRDFKPENVLVGADGRVRVSDFGLARLHGRHDDASGAGADATRARPDVSATGSLVGTPFYMAPEQYLGLSADARSDQFSFCVALWLAITGVHPFDGEGLEGLADAVTHGRRRAAPRPDPMPAWLGRVLARGLAVDPAARYPGLAALLAALGRNPRRRLLRLAGASAALVAVVLGGVLAYRQGTTQPALLCQGAELKWAGVWDPPRRAALEAAFVATGQPQAAAQAAQVERQLDTYARDWSKMHTEACRATRVRGDQPEALLQERMVCLDARLRDARALLDRLVRPDAALVEKAPAALTMLGELDGCADVQALTSQVPLPASAALRARVLEIRGQLAEVKAARVARSATARADAAPVRAVVGAAVATRYRPLEAEALLEEAQGESEAADFAAAAATLEQAIWAAEAGRADELQARAWIRLMTAKRLGGAAAKDALALRPRVTALVERMGGNERVEGLFRATSADLLLAADDYPGAKIEAAAGLALLEKHRGADDPDLADATDALGAIAVDEGRVDEGVACFVRSLTLRRHAYGPGHPLVVMATRHLGYALIKAGRPFEAIAVLAQALAVLERTVGPGHPDVPDLLYHLGLAYQNTGELARAATTFERAIAASRSGTGSETATVGDFLTARGYALMSLGHDDEAVRVLEQALGVFERTEGKDNTSCAYPLRHLIEAEMTLGRYDAARAHAARAIRIWEAALGPETPKLIEVLLLLGLVEVEARHPARAVPVLERALRLSASDGDALTRAQLEFVLAEALLQSGGDRGRAVELARTARAAMAATPGQKDNLAEVDGWLRRNAER